MLMCILHSEISDWLVITEVFHRMLVCRSESKNTSYQDIGWVGYFTMKTIKGTIVLNSENLKRRETEENRRSKCRPGNLST